ncbi:MAG: carbohydrate ABC transporter substrate-binding protein [Oscillospiraceae bacterium]|nr:carbohydrate ABC transporter substrate-binding protein [Oscillospiraceae bacterium]
MKKALSLLAALSLMASFTACSNTSSPAATDPVDDNSPADSAPVDSEEETPSESTAEETGDKKELRVWAFTDEVPGMVQKYLDTHDLGDKYVMKESIIATTDGAYQPALDAALAGDEVDMYAAEAAFILKYSQGEAAKYAATYEDLGIDVDAKIKEAEIAQYTVDIGTNPDGKVVGLGYQATGGAFIYRRSIAKDAFGSDDPDTVKSEIGPGWDKFFEAADKLKAKGYGIVSGDGDIWHAVENSSDTGWIKDGKLHIDPKREEFLDLSKKLMDNDYHNDTQDWQEAWFADMAGTGKKGVLGFFGPAWLINYTIAKNCGREVDEATGEVKAEGTWGDWAVCEPPIGFFWGGTWVLGANASPNKDAVGEIIEWITLDTSEEGLQYMWANGTYNPDNATKDAVASNVVMKKSDGKIDFLSGQNMFDIFVPANEFANGKNLTPYDETINTAWRDQVRQYTAGNKSRDEAIADFKQAVSDQLDIDAE